MNRMKLGAGLIMALIGLSAVGLIFMEEGGGITGPDVDVTVTTFPLPSAPSKNPNYNEPKSRYDAFSTHYNGAEWSYYIYPGEKKKVTTPRPLVVLLHGSQRSGAAMVDMWKMQADKENLVLIAPNSPNPKEWKGDDATLDFIARLPDIATLHHAVDKSRVYLFGHSSGAILALRVADRRPGPFAAVALHAGMASPVNPAGTGGKPPILYINGTQDITFPFDKVLRSARQFKQSGHEVAVYKFEGHGHWYYEFAPLINSYAWHFLSYYPVQPVAAVEATPAPAQKTAKR